MRFEIWQKGVVAGGSLLLVLTTGVCTGTAPPASTPDNALTNHPVSPTPDIEATVQARVKDERAVEATVEAKAPALAKTLVEATAKAAPSQTSTFTPALSPTPTPKPEVQIVTEERDLQLANFAWTRDWMGKQDLIGVVRNEGTSTLSGVSVTLEFLDRAGRRAVDVRDASVLLAGEIGPGEQVPFVSGLPEATGGERWDLEPIQQP